LNIKKQEKVVNQFSWAQWEPQYQCLFFIHYSNVTNSNAGEASLSALQFHDEPQHETVVFFLLLTTFFVLKNNFFDYISVQCPIKFAKSKKNFRK